MRNYCIFIYYVHATTNNRINEKIPHVHLILYVCYMHATNNNQINSKIMCVPLIILYPAFIQLKIIESIKKSCVFLRFCTYTREIIVPTVETVTISTPTLIITRIPSTLQHTQRVSQW